MIERHRTRIPPVDLERLTGEQREVADRITGTRGRVAGPFTVLLHVPTLTERIERLGAYLRYEATLDRDVAETAVLTTARVCGSPFEWQAHEPLARGAGVPDEVIGAIRADAGSASMPPRYRTAYDYASELASYRRVSDEAYAAAVDLLGVAGTVELTVLIGYYTLLAMTLSAHHLEDPNAGARFFGVGD